MKESVERLVIKATKEIVVQMEKKETWDLKETEVKQVLQGKLVWKGQKDRKVK